MNVLLPETLRLTAAQMATNAPADFSNYYVPASMRGKRGGRPKVHVEVFDRVLRKTQVVPADSPMGVFIQGLTKAEVAG